jgi:hypothetical protein
MPIIEAGTPACRHGHVTLKKTLKKCLTSFFEDGIGLENPIILGFSFINMPQRGGEGFSIEKRLRNSFSGQC